MDYVVDLLIVRIRGDCFEGYKYEVDILSHKNPSHAFAFECRGYQREINAPILKVEGRVGV